MTNLIRTEGICRSFQTGQIQVQALKDVNIQVPEGGLTILRGRSGSGKTTLMNILSALDFPSQGHVYYDEMDITALKEDQRDKLRRTRMGFVFQSVALMGQMSAYENVEFGLRIAGVPANGRRQRAVECLERVGLAKRMKHRPAELSGGEQQRVAIARAIAHKPAVVFADEPTAELDTKMALNIMRLFQELVERERITVIMTTHDPYMVELADQVYTLEDGQIISAVTNREVNSPHADD
ncbi:MAG: ABC transporter ATP-binding protein [Christensenellales bacterium]|jgi:putative ABC transport system ATP-binding protein